MIKRRKKKHEKKRITEKTFVYVCDFILCVCVSVSVCARVCNIFCGCKFSNTHLNTLYIN